MSIKKELFRLFGFNSNRTSSKVTESSHLQQPVIKRMHHRGYLMESSTEGVDSWKAKINGKVITGEQAFIKESIDWWCDKKTELSPEKASSHDSSKRKVEVHQGFKIMNDTGEHNGWYMLHNGKLLKGTKKAIEARIDIAVERLRRKQK